MSRVLNKFINEQNYKTVKTMLTETSMSRVWQHIEGGGSFGVISPYRANLQDDENQRRYAELKNTVRELGYGFIEMEGGFNEEGNWVIEKSLFIPNISRNEIIKLGTKYDQYSVIYKDNNEFVEIGTNDAAGIGQVKNDFVKQSGQKNLAIDGELTKSFFSRLVKGSHADKKFLFNMGESFLYELEPLNFNQVAYGKNERHKRLLFKN